MTAEDAQDRALERLGRWLRAQATRKGDECNKAELWHLGATDKESGQLSDYLIEADSSEALNALAAEIYEDASDAAESFEGPQRFACRLYRLKLRRPRAQHLWMIDGGGAGGLVGAGTEPPNSVGITKALMRHMEARERTNAILHANTYGTLMEELKHMRAQVRDSEKSRLEVFELVERLSSDTHARMLEQNRETRRELRMDEGLQTLKLVMPAIVGHVSKKLGGPQLPTTTAESLQLHAWLESLTREQFATVLAGMSPTQQMALLELMKMHTPAALPEAPKDGGGVH